ncbi:VOC family protein [Nocardia terpenica]|uniref:VOC family protein n=1 Tax=Nocardia terpenica TaxID=455432 RepID=UPI001893A1A4|nr:VOC family protein [Nocardia terpenica]MBF6061621.1 VOC family protein [Nocardia terpenica]MBF6107584.1 VOC family protein [Nocardia terpenica]MBF6110041.1 VOC family protein [Nocardia terpenica]MBF6122447.1 VOC family protein [Nocardia terpenica]MBF6151377.1 VOC family protein [Nocardia terpenica]
MRDAHDAFHLAIPARDLDEAERFYVRGLGAKLARRYDDRITLDFFGDQVVCHLSDRIDPDPRLYPRHFGVTFRERADFDRLLRLVRLRKLAVFSPVSTRFGGTAEEHLTVVLRDPSNNLLEFKHYLDPRMMY